MGLDVVDIWTKQRPSEVMSLIKGKGMESHPHLAARSPKILIRLPHPHPPRARQLEGGRPLPLNPAPAHTSTIGKT